MNIIRGSEDSSAPIEMLGFKVTLASFNSNKLDLKFEFDFPLSVSIGDKFDTLMFTFVESDLFISSETGKTLASDTVISKQIPK